MTMTYKSSTDKSLYWDFAQLTGWRYGVNGVTRPEAYDGNTTRNSGIRMWDRNWIACTAQNAAETITKNAHGLDNGTIVYLTGTTVPTGLAFETLYYVISTAANTFQVSLTSGGAAVTFTTDGAGLYYSQSNAPAALAEGAGGTLTLLATYKYRYTYYNATNGVESDPSNSGQFTLTAANQTITFDIPVNASYDTQVTHVRIYRTNANGNIYRYEQQIAYTGAKLNNQSSTIADTLLGANYGEIDISGIIQTPTNGIMPTSRFTTAWNNRIWAYGDKPYIVGTVSVTQNGTVIIGDGTVWTEAMIGWTIKVGVDAKTYTVNGIISTTILTISEVYAATTASTKSYVMQGDSGYAFCSHIDENNNIRPEYFPAANYLSTDPQDGDEDNGIIGCNTRLLCFKKRSIYAIAGDTMSNYVSYKIVSPVGTCADRTLVNDATGNVIFMADNGVYWTNGEGIPTKISGAIENMFTGEGTAPFFINTNRLSDSHAAFDKYHNMLFLWVSSSDSSITNKVLMADFNLINEQSTPEWFIFDIDANDSAIGVDTDGIPYVYFADEDGYIYKIGSYTNDGAGSSVAITKRGTVTSATANSLTDSTAHFNTAGDGFKSLYVSIIGGTGIGQRKKILLNTGTKITITNNWDTIPDTTSIYAVGAIDAYWQGKVFTWDMLKYKAIRWIKVIFKRQSSAYNLSVTRYADQTIEDNTLSTPYYGGGETQYVDMYSNISNYKKVLFSVNKGIKHQIKLSLNDVDRPFNVSELEIAVQDRGRL